MTTPSRDRILILLFPAALVALVWWGLLRPTSQLREAVALEESARAAIPAPAVLTAQTAKMQKLKAAEAQLAQERKTWLASWEQMRQQRSNLMGRAASLAHVTDVLRRHDLTLIREEPPTKGKGGPEGQALAWVVNRMRRPTSELMPELAAVRKADNKPGTAAAQSPAPAKSWSSKNTTLVNDKTLSDLANTRSTWKVEFAGHYADVQAALAELAAEDTGAIPVQLLMVKAKQNLTLRRWTLVVAL